ncbi:MAG: PQQ-dependent sugar dehydrogenase [Microthrixaceae bacterium]
MSAPPDSPPCRGTRLASLGAITAIVVAMAALGGGGATLAAWRADPTSPSRAATDRPCPAPREAAVLPLPADVHLFARPVGSADRPTSVALDPVRLGQGVVAERSGRVVLIVDGAVTDRVVLDLHASTSSDGDGGLLGVAYAPDGRWLYLVRQTLDRDDVVTAHPLDDAGIPRDGEGRTILRIDHPRSDQHHGGSIAMTPDGALFVGTGDGGGLGDPRDNAQDPSTLLGKVLRIIPTPEAGRPYRIPPDNPFREEVGWAPEIFALGVRNPFRITLDEPTNELWLGDVGQSCWEELNRLRLGRGGDAGRNLGWDRTEGDEDFEGGTPLGRVLRPTHVYGHPGGQCAIVAGPVLRGQRIPALEGWVLFTDFCGGRLRALDADGRRDRTSARVDPEVVDLGIHIDEPVSIVIGPTGRPWVVSLSGWIYELFEA